MSIDKQKISQTKSNFDSIVHLIFNEEDKLQVEIWFARELMELLGYARWENFQVAIGRAVESCKAQGINVDDHFREATNLIKIGKGGKREVMDYRLTRFACYLIAQNGDPKKEEIAFALHYFASQPKLTIRSNHTIKKMIYLIDGQQVILDKDLAILYQTETRSLKQAVKRNISRFPADFMFELSDSQMDVLVSQFVIPSKRSFGGARPYAFTEQGVAMLSAVLRTPVAVDISLKIIRAFIEMRKILHENALVFQRLDRMESKQRDADRKFEQIFKALDSGKPEPVSGIFYDGQIFDAHAFVSDLIRKARKSLVLIDNYIDDTVFTLFLKRKAGVKVTFYTRNISPQLKLDAEKHNAQHTPVELKKISVAHDRFLIIDDTELYHIGASVKDLGKKWFAFSRMDTEVADLLKLLKIKINE